MSTLPSSIPNAMYMTPYESVKPWDVNSYQFFLDLGYVLKYHDDNFGREEDDFLPPQPYLEWKDSGDIDDLTEAAISHLWDYRKVMDELVYEKNKFRYESDEECD